MYCRIQNFCHYMYCVESLETYFLLQINKINVKVTFFNLVVVFLQTIFAYCMYVLLTILIWHVFLKMKTNFQATFFFYNNYSKVHSVHITSCISEYNYPFIRSIRVKIIIEMRIYYKANKILIVRLST